MEESSSFNIYYFKDPSIPHFLKDKSIEDNKEMALGEDLAAEILKGINKGEVGKQALYYILRSTISRLICGYDTKVVQQSASINKDEELKDYQNLLTYKFYPAIYKLLNEYDEEMLKIQCKHSNCSYEQLRKDLPRKERTNLEV